MERLIRSGTLQAKLRIGQPGDEYEQEADRVAEQVMINDFEMGITPSPLSVQRTCVEGSWVFEYDGCSLPWYVLPLIGTLDKDNPAGGTDTDFSNPAGTGPCDRHDECYQTCNPSPGAREACDRRMYDNMMNVCRRSAESPEIKSRCFHFAGVYYIGLKAFGGGAFNERQMQVCYCQIPPPTTPGTFQAKLRIGQPRDIYEQEADRVAEQVMLMPEPVQRKCPRCLKGLRGLLEKDKKDEKLQTKDAISQTTEVTTQTEANFKALKGGGQPLPESTRAFMEQRFGYDFSQVRVHTDAKAEESAKAVNAKAYTVGKDVVFGEGQYSPGTSEGKKLMAHELTHVVQQSRATSNMTIIQRNPDVGADECAERGPPDRESYPLIYNCQEAKRLGRLEQERCKRPAVGYAQQKLNKFLQMYDNWIAGKSEEKIACVGDQNLIQSIRHSLNPSQLKVDCWFGGETEKATRMFQRCYGFEEKDIDGKIGEKTWPALESVVGGAPPKTVPPKIVPPKTEPPPPTHGKCQWPPQNPTPIPVPQQYSSINPILLSKLRTSYIAHQGSDAGADFLANGFWRSDIDPANNCTWPQTLWEALDIMGPDDLDTIDRVRNRAELYNFLWQSIQRIRNAWTLSSSLGFQFLTPDENSLEDAIKRSDDFCRDIEWAECLYHNCQRCYREVGRVNIEGLHVCFGNGLYPNIHIDPHQIAEGKEQNGICNIDWIAWGKHASDVVLPGWNGQKSCVIAQGACCLPGGLASDDDIRQYNEYCRKQTGYKGPDIKPDCEKVRCQ